MGFLDALLGRRKVKGPAPDRLFAITTAAIELEAAHGIRTRGKAAIVFQPLATGDFQRITAEMEEIVRSTGEETGTTLTTADDPYGYRWMVLSDPDVEDLAVGINAVGEALAAGGYADRVLCAVFDFEDAQGRAVYFIYNYKRGTFYPFVPAGSKQRDNQRELQVKAMVGRELPVEPELERWFPLWDAPI